MRPATWTAATVASTVPETATARSLILDVPGWNGHISGQHVDIRLTAPDGYQATRSYSLSGGPREPPQITVERVPDGEVSPYMVDVALPGDRLEVRGPLGGYFVWSPDDRPLLLVGGGSGIAPLRSMWRAGGREIRVVYSARTADRVIFAEELAETAGVDARIHLTREAAPGYVARRVDEPALMSAIEDFGEPAVYVCGPTAFVESVASDLGGMLGSGYPIKTERFG